MTVVMEILEIKTRLIRYAVALTLIAIAAQLAVYWRTGFDGWTMYAVFFAAWFAVAVIGVGLLSGSIRAQTAAMCGLLVALVLIVVAPVLNPANSLNPTWYLVLVLYSYIFFSRKLSLIIMLSIYGYFVIYALFLMPDTYNLGEVVTFTTSMFVTGALCSAASRESSQLYKRLGVAANTDPMTSLWNRRGVEKLFLELVTLNQNTPQPYSIAVLDLDNFKLINDRLGHKTGDNVICLAADLIRNVTREHDIVARVGGEEFLLILPRDTTCRMRRIADRIRARFETEVLTTVGDDFKNIATLSIGVVHNIPPHITLSEAMQLGDRLMYAAKDKGRNVLVAASYDDSLTHETDILKKTLIHARSV